MNNIFNSFKALSTGLKILVVFTAIVAVSGICTATYMIINNSNVTELASNDNVEVEQIAEDIIEGVSEEKIEVTYDMDAVVEEEEKTVKYKDKEIKIPKSKVAEVNSAEDAQKQKSGGDQMSASDAIDKFENDGQSVGIDVSKHQGNINWAQVKASGIEFAMIRCGFRGQTAGTIYEDIYFKTNINGAVSNGIKVGIYFYSCAINEEEALQEAAWVVDKIKSYRITYPVVYDFEDFGRYRCAGVSGEQATSNAIAFLNYVKSAGYTPMMYASKNDITNRFNRSRLSGYKFWLAHYTTATNYTGTYHMWQYTSNGSVAGISGRVDMNVAYFRYGAVAEPKHTHDFEKGSVINTNESKAATCTESGVKFIRCAACSESKKVEIPKLGHKYGEWIIDEKATIESVGSKHRICSTCKNEEKVEIPKLDKDTNTTNSTTNTTTNTTTNNTTNNSTNTTPDTGTTCNHNFVQYDSKNATCTENGYKKTKCEKCGLEGDTETITAKGHSYGDWIIDSDSTTEIEGTKHRECINCGNTENGTIPKKEPAIDNTQPIANTAE